MSWTLERGREAETGRPEAPPRNSASSARREDSDCRTLSSSALRSSDAHTVQQTTAPVSLIHGTLLKEQHSHNSNGLERVTKRGHPLAVRPVRELRPIIFKARTREADTSSELQINGITASHLQRQEPQPEPPKKPEPRLQLHPQSPTQAKTAKAERPLHPEGAPQAELHEAPSLHRESAPDEEKTQPEPPREPAPRQTLAPQSPRQANTAKAE